MFSLEFIEKSRKKINKGDIFVIKMNNYFIPGLVITNNVISSDELIDGAISIILFKSKFKYIEDIDVGNIQKYDFLVNPLIVNKKGWTQGYFKNIANIINNEILKEKSIVFKCPITNKLFDLQGNIIISIDNNTLVGSYTLGNHLTLEDRVNLIIKENSEWISEM